MKKILAAILLSLFAVFGFILLRAEKPFLFVKGVASESTSYDPDGQYNWSTLKLTNGHTVKLRYRLGDRIIPDKSIDIVQFDSFVPTIVPCDLTPGQQYSFYSTSGVAASKSGIQPNLPTNFPTVATVEELVQRSEEFLNALASWPTSPENGVIDCLTPTRGMKYWRDNSSGPSYSIDAKAICKQVKETCLIRR